MSHINVKNNATWIGQRDWKCAISTAPNAKRLRGSTYNSYLIREEKTVLI